MAPHTLRADGGSRGNPGPAAAGFVLEGPDGAVISRGGRYLGETTNNVAEYEAFLWGLDTAIALGITSLDVRLDSELVVKQVRGEYRVKNDKLRQRHARAMEMLDRFEQVSVEHVPREENIAADTLVNEALEVRGEVGDGLRGEYDLTVKAHFDAAHELAGYPGECRGLHGHTWDVEVTVVGVTLDDVGIVYDFKRLKDDLTAVLDPLDHAHLNEVAPYDRINPTAENLAREICHALERTVGPGVRVTEVAVWESPIAKIVFRPA